MKTLFSILMICFSLQAFPQEPTQNKPTNKVLKDTVIKEVSYKLYQGSRGGKYIVRQSKNGNTYKQYIKKP